MPSDDGIIVLGIDLDGVCANFYARMREIAAEWFEVDVQTLTESPSYGLEEWGIDPKTDQYQQLHRTYVDDAPVNIDALRKRGHYAVCFGNSTNEHVAAPRAMSWDDVYSAIQARRSVAGVD